MARSFHLRVEGEDSRAEIARWGALARVRFSLRTVGAEIIVEPRQEDWIGDATADETGLLAQLFGVPFVVDMDGRFLRVEGDASPELARAVATWWSTCLPVITRDLAEGPEVTSFDAADLGADGRLSRRVTSTIRPCDAGSCRVVTEDHLLTLPSATPLGSADDALERVGRAMERGAQSLRPIELPAVTGASWSVRARVVRDAASGALFQLGGEIFASDREDGDFARAEIILTPLHEDEPAR